MMAKKIYFVAGEMSGDDHGASLMHALRDLWPDLQFSGRGGPKMKEIAGEAFHNWIDDAGVVGLWEVVRTYPYFRRKFRETVGQIDRDKPEAVVLIDYPGFNLRLARALRQRASSLKLIYYISPQVWAWNRGRIKKMAHWLDLMLCIFPFEAELYNASGLRTIFVGHPMIDRLSAHQIETSRDHNLVALFPGSRRREVRKIFPIMLKSAIELLATNPDLRFEIAASSSEIAQEIRAKLKPPEKYKDRFQLRLDGAAPIMQHAFAGMIASGTATQEAAYFRLPFVLVYKVSWPTYLVGRSVIKVDYLGMPNVLAKREVVPEFIQHRARPEKIANAMRRIMDDSVPRREMISAFDEIIASLGKGGASNRAARAIVEELGAEA